MTNAAFFIICLIVVVLCFVMLGLFLLNIADQIKRIANHFQGNAPKTSTDEIVESLNAAAKKLEDAVKKPKKY